VEKASQDLDQSKAEAMARKLAKGQFDLNDLATQLQQMKKMGGLQGIMGMLPGVAKMKSQMADSGVDDRMIARQEAIISSMTKAERKKPDLLNASRRKRIAAGAGVEVQDINRLLKQHRQMADMVKSMSRGGGKKMQQMAAMMGGLGGGAGGMGGPDMARLKALGGGKIEPGADEMKALQDRLSGLGGGSMPGGLPGLPGFPPKKN
ncbi:MAG: signal recognition particle protein, partial [Alphaproteobacteria bacterium]